MSNKIQFMHYPDAVLNQRTGLYEVPLEDAAPLTTPSMRTVQPFGTGAEIICNEAIYMYRCAESLGELEKTMAVDPYLAARMFSLIALHAEIKEVSIALNGGDGFAVMTTGQGEQIKAHWMCGEPTIGICGGWDIVENKERQDAANNSPRKVLPSDLLYALSIMAQQAAIGSTGFLIRWDYSEPENLDSNMGYVIVAFNDVDMPNTYFGTRFPVGGKAVV